MARRLALGPDQRNKSTLLLVLLAIVLLLATVFALTTVSAASTSLRAAAAAATKVAVFVATTDDSYVLAAIATLENVRAQNPAASLRRSPKRRRLGEVEELPEGLCSTLQYVLTIL